MAMEQIKSLQISNLGVNLEKIGDLLYHEGPLLSLFKDKNNSDNYYLYKWADNDENYNRWLVFHVNKEDLRRFFFQELSLKQLLLLNSFVFLIDIDNNLNIEQYLIVAQQELPSSYFPKENSYYKEGKYTELAQYLKHKLLVEQEDIYTLVSATKSEISSLREEFSKISFKINQLAGVSH